MRSRSRVIWLLCALLPGPALAAERIAVFDPELYDTSGEGLREDQQHRLHLLGEALRRALAESGRYEVVAIPEAVRARLASGPSLRSCAPCAPDAAAELGAGLAATMVVHKVSNLIISITVALREAPSGAPRAVHSAEIRGNTDESWLRGLRWILRNRLLPEASPK
ncbi:DUF3280 domain-containing protein [Roseicella aquatilis]|uniref:DUF2380 domain-containing protein n=1 Tax=Roseicella aquatilis TaxID=2527868 RepID=A0A4R4DR97_9PROT|nr:DUF3280 domain-containing protein [Roseicella aquatilis]TCZ64892.1 DUF2380 domain-containing protein [Roseicella aquatilis]